MELLIKLPDGYVGVVMQNQRIDGSAMDKLLRLAVIDGTPLPKGCDIQRIIPKRVDVQKWIYTVCPNCGRELSTHHGDGYYIIEHKPDFCPNCGQALLWESEGKE